jgi:hypothetical protein
VGRRSRWLAAGVSLAVVAGAGGVLTSAAGSPGASSFVPITPCRLLDTRPAPDTVGPRSTPLGPVTTFTSTVWGANGNCNVPSGATGVSMNIAIVNPTAASFLTAWPADQVRPLAASLNWVANQAPTPNAVTTALSVDGKISFYNLAGNVDLVIDVVGFYEPSSSGPAGPTGPQGPSGPQGPAGAQGIPGVDPANVVWVAKSGGDFTSVSAALASITSNSASNRFVVKVAPGTYDEPAGVTMKDYVDIEGSGRSVTTISRSIGTAIPQNDPAAATIRVVGDLHAEVRGLTVVSALSVAPPSPGSWNAVGIYVKDAPSGNVWITDVAVSVTGDSAGAGLNKAAIAADASSPTITSVAVDVIGTGFANVGLYTVNASSPVVLGLTAAAAPATASAAILSSGSGTVTVRDSVLGGVSSIFQFGTSTFRLADTQILGFVPGTNVTCVNAYDSDFVALPADCIP